MPQRITGALPKQKRSLKDWLLVRYTDAGGRKITRPGSMMLFVITMLTVIAIGWGTDHRSCQRQVPVRSASNQRAYALRDAISTGSRELLFASAQFDRHHDHQAAWVAWWIAIHWQRDAQSIVKLVIPNCDKFVPDT